MLYLRLTTAAILSTAFALTASGCGSEHAQANTHPTVRATSTPLRHFTEFNETSTTDGLVTMLENFRKTPVVRVQTSSGASLTVPRDVVLSPQGVYTKSGAGTTASESVVIDGKAGYLRSSAAFWTRNGLEAGKARTVQGRWVKTSAVVDEEQTLAVVRERMTTQFAVDWGLGFGTEPEPIKYQGKPAVKFWTPGGYVIGAGNPFLPVKYVFESDSLVETMTFTYKEVAPVKAPAAAVGLDALVYRR